MSSFRKENAARQTEFRLAALANGYTPLPNNNKAIYYENWGEVEVTPALIREWGKGLSYQATGLRIENGLCGLDIDIDDAKIVGELWDFTVTNFPQMREALVRSGSGAKEAWFCRTDEEFSRIASTRHVKPGCDPDGENVSAYLFESFGGGHKRQMGGSGAHTMLADNSGFKIEYEWSDDESPADVMLDDLPMLPKSAVLTIAEYAGELLRKYEWPRITHAKSGETSCEVIYDLTEDMKFHCIDGQTRRLSQLADYALVDNGARCSASWTGDRTMLNRTRCLIHVDRKGVPSVLETSSYGRHMPAVEKDRNLPTSEKSNLLADKMRDAGYTFVRTGYENAPASFADVTLKLLGEWAWCGSRNVPCLPIYRAEELGQPLTNLRLSNLRHSYEEEGPRGGVKIINPVDAWVKHSQREDVDGYRYMPAHPVGLHTVEDARYINSYRAPHHVLVEQDDERSAYIAVWMAFMTHLIPDAAERKWFLDSLAHKRQHPEVPGVATIMVAKRFGVGRGTLFGILGAVFGNQNVKNVSAGLLMGTDQQGQYTDWLAKTLYVFTDEVLPEGDDGAAMAWRRKKAYEKLKERVDPAAREVLIVRKTLPNYHDMVHATFILATQHENAVPLPEGDRRFTVITNNMETLAENVSLEHEINELRREGVFGYDEKFIGAIDAWLAARDVSRFNAQVAPMFEGKIRMQDSNNSEIDDLVGDVLDNLPYDWCTVEAVLDRVEKTLISRGIKEEYPKWRNATRDLVTARWHRLGRQYIDAAFSKKVTVLVASTRAVAAFKALTPAEREAQAQEMSRLGASATARAARKGIKAV